ncbi:autotransporter outer membrane beta-barrel domain-containing protein [Helicobacter winghamensis]|uniref:Toxin n=1 Tax=Helicobacter winghamensis TaxID=157268 RepID=A0A2N3PKQ5_9HELI|nr:autotransporter outer membrane beta-barrel domain-containing protein [Helicobacter winghamensis]EEO26040.1 autotransporter beta-domain protein [Helicobacter winghamensis ATCC BAA-430]PKT78838.1 toxin [Helicobacter winghamensis]PKT78869.1 toxin [Helicobacter winghamensis]PKT78977.1 toxin [Helicobacter winghamensis]PKT82197.1 toxin [Helicobacter winghamensis]
MGANSSANTAMNISNETSITARNVQYSNPYALAKLLRDSKLAALDSDTKFDYYGINNSVNSVWANAFGGANIIDGDNGSLYGVSIGYDRQITDAVLLGVYGTYSNSEIKDSGSTSESDNFQLGFYANYKFAPTWELNAKAYGQLSKTDLENTLTTGIVNADYTQRFFDLSANEPFAGVNYYYGYTPDYTETGVLAKHIRSMSSNSVSLEAGAEFRKYVNENSYLFITPKIEQYVINNGDDYVAKFIGSTSNFSIEGSDKKKTYGQIIIGGSMNINDSLSLNAGIGAKHL